MILSANTVELCIVRDNNIRFCSRKDIEFSFITYLQPFEALGLSEFIFLPVIIKYPICPTMELIMVKSSS